MSRIYLDHAATTPLQPRAKEAMAPWLESRFGNPSSLYAEGREARQAIDASRERISRLIGAEFAEVLFTSSGTEAANLAVVGAALAHKGARRRILFSAAEHHAVLRTEPLLARLGYRVEAVAVDRNAVLDLDNLESRLGDDVLLIAAMHANNELGSRQPVRQIAALAREHGALFLCDAVQTLGAFDWAVDDLGADLVTLAGHKVYGPKGAGALYVRAGTPIQPLSVGGGQEREMRAGTENVAAIVGFATAVDEVSKDLEGRERKAAACHRFRKGLEGEGAVFTLEPEVAALSGHAHLRFPGLGAESLLIVLDRMGVSASSGAACSSGGLEPSHVLLAAGYSEAEAKEGLRFTFGAHSTEAEAEEAAVRVLVAVRQVRR